MFFFIRVGRALPRALQVLVFWSTLGPAGAHFLYPGELNFCSVGGEVLRIGGLAFVSVFYLFFFSSYVGITMR